MSPKICYLIASLCATYIAAILLKVPNNGYWFHELMICVAVGCSTTIAVVCGLKVVKR
jgi:hypothetical protein